VHPSRAWKAIAVALALCVEAVPVLVILGLPPPGFTYSPPYRSITYGTWNDVSPAWSPNGSLVAFATDRDGGWQIHVIATDGSGDRQLTPPTMVASYPAWSPDSSGVAFWSRSGNSTDIRVAFLRNSTILTVTDGKFSVVEGQPRWSPDGTRLLFFTESSSIQLVSADLTDGTFAVLATLNGSILQASWASDTAVVYSTYGPSGYDICQAALGLGEEGCALQGNANYTSPVVSPDGSRVAYISDLVPDNPYGMAYPSQYEPSDFNLWASDVDFSNPVFQSGPTPIFHAAGTTYPYPFAPGRIDPSQSLAWSPNGEVLAYTAFYASYGTGLYLWNVINRTSTEYPLGPLNASISSPSWSPDNVDIAFSAMTGGFYHIFVLNYPRPVPPMEPAETQ